jgi:hypothetical protein
MLETKDAQKLKTRIFSIFFFFENHVVSKIVFKNTLRPDMSLMRTKYIPETLDLYAGDLRQESAQKTTHNISHLLLNN